MENQSIIQIAHQAQREDAKRREDAASELRRRLDEKREDERRTDERRQDEQRRDDLRADDNQRREDARRDEDRRSDERRTDERRRDEQRRDDLRADERRQELRRDESSPKAPADQQSAAEVEPPELLDAQSRDAAQHVPQQDAQTAQPSATPAPRPDAAVIEKHRQDMEQDLATRQAARGRAIALEADPAKRERMEKEGLLEMHLHKGHLAELSRDGAAAQLHHQRAEALRGELEASQDTQGLRARSQARNQAAVTANQAAGKLAPSAQTANRAQGYRARLAQQNERRLAQQNELSATQVKQRERSL